MRGCYGGDPPLIARNDDGCVAVDWDVPRRLSGSSVSDLSEFLQLRNTHNGDDDRQEGPLTFLPAVFSS